MQLYSIISRKVSAKEVSSIDKAYLEIIMMGETERHDVLVVVNGCKLMQLQVQNGRIKAW